MSDATAAADLMFRPVGELAGLVRSGELSARELVQSSLDRIEALDGELNAFVDVWAEEALADADRVGPGDERPFAGVPIAIKNNRGVEGRRLTYGADLFGDFRAPLDHNVVRRLKAAGFVLVGSTTLPEYGIVPVTENRRLGATRNPWDPSRTPGGSSGGSAAAVAAGMVPIAHGNDGGGSIRTPAACCGLVGLKPSRGRISRGPDLGDSWLASDGVLTRTVADAALALDVLGGYEVGDANWAPRPIEPYVTAVRRDPGKLRIAMTTENVLGAEVDAECVRGMRLAGEILAALGHEVEEAAPALPGPEVFEIFLAAFTPGIGLGINHGVLLAGREPSEDEIEPLSRALYERAQATPSIAYLGAVAQLQALARGIVAFFADYDVLLTPGLAARPPAIGEINGLGERPMEDLERSGRWTPFRGLFNVPAQPAMTLPGGIGGDGLPTGVQIVGKPLCEDTLLQVAAQVELAHPWAHHRPEPVVQA